MSYCRFSSDDYQCDVYVYADVGGGFSTHVASRRYVFKDSLPPPVDAKDFDAWWARDARVKDMIDRAKMRPIGLPFDGEYFNDPTEMACAERLESLKGVGYNVPQRAIDALREEARSVGDGTEKSLAAPVTPKSVSSDALNAATASLRELIQAMRDYEMNVDEIPPYKHQDMMERATASLRTIEAVSSPKSVSGEQRYAKIIAATGINPDYLPTWCNERERDQQRLDWLCDVAQGDSEFAKQIGVINSECEKDGMRWLCIGVPYRATERAKDMREAIDLARSVSSPAGSSAKEEDKD